MTLHRDHRRVSFECDDCGETLDTDEDDFYAAVEEMKSAGWWAIPLALLG